MIVENGPSFIQGLEAERDRFDKEFGVRIDRTMRAAMLRLMAKTPVNTGTAVASYVASVDYPRSVVVDMGKAVEATNRLALGVEQKRPAAQAVARSTLDKIDYKDPYRLFYITNSTPYIADLEAGRPPPSPGMRARSPMGMFYLTLLEIKSLWETRQL